VVAGGNRYHREPEEALLQPAQAKSKISAFNDGDLRPDQVKLIALPLELTSRTWSNMNRRLGGDASLNAPIATTANSGEWQDWLADESESQESAMAEHEEIDNRRKAAVRLAQRDQRS